MAVNCLGLTTKGHGSFIVVYMDKMNLKSALLSTVSLMYFIVSTKTVFLSFKIREGVGLSIILVIFLLQLKHKLNVTIKHSEPANLRLPQLCFGSWAV